MAAGAHGHLMRDELVLALMEEYGVNDNVAERAASDWYGSGMLSSYEPGDEKLLSLIAKNYNF